MRGKKLASGLGWFSIGLGLSEVLAPGRLADLAGLENRPSVLRALGLRELATGAGILTRVPRGGLWARVAGDVMDLAVMAKSRRLGPAASRRFAVALGVVAAIGVLDLVSAGYVGNA